MCAKYRTLPRLLLNSHIYLHEFVWDTKQFNLTDQKTDEADYHRGNIYVKLNEHLLSYTLVNIGVLEFGGLLGAFIFSVNGIGITHSHCPGNIAQRYSRIVNPRNEF